MITPLATDNSTQIGKENLIIPILPHWLLYIMQKNQNPLNVFYWFIEQNQVMERDNS